MKVYVISDTHFYHANVIEYCNRPFNSVIEMNSFMTKQWNSIIHKDDMVIHLGDVGLGNKEKIKEIVSKLNGRKMLIMGNHDNFTEQTYRDMGFERVSRFPIVYNGYILSHAPLQCNCGDLFNVYGHVHNNPDFVDNEHSKCVSVERINYTPIFLYDTITGERGI